MYKILCAFLLIVIGSSTSFNKDTQWCYCTNCNGGIPYCKTFGGMCYAEVINNTYYNYGCLGSEVSANICTLNTSIYYDREDHIYTHKITCCNTTEWCNANPITLAMVHDRLPDVRRENDFDKQSCYCNGCENKKNCLTNGWCYRDLSHYASPTYGCIENSLSCGTTHSRQLSVNFYDPPMQCCKGEKWCNFDVELISEYHMLDVDLELKIRWIRFEYLGYFENWSSYQIMARNRIGGKMLINFGKLSLDSRYTVEANITNGTFNFGVEHNVLYEFQLKPYIGSYPIESRKMIFYFATMFRANVTWFRNIDNYNNSSGPTVVICGSCLKSGKSYECLSCTKYDPYLNPIQLPEWS